MNWTLPPAAIAAQPPGAIAAGERPPEASGLAWGDAVRLAVSRYPSIAAARSSLNQQASLVDAARAGYRPQVRAEITTGEQGEYGTGQVATLGLSQMLYDFGKTGSAVERERAAVRRENAAVLLAIDEVLEETVRALIEVHRYQTLRRTLGTQLEALGKVRDITELRAAAGATSRSDPVQARARVEAVQARLLAVESQSLQWRSRLQTYIGDQGMQEVAGAPVGVLELASADAQIGQLPAIRIAEAGREEAEAALRNIRAQRYPTVSLEANANQRMGTAGDRYQEIYGKSSYGTAFVVIQGSLYQGGALSAQVRAGASALQAAEQRLQAERMNALDALRRHREQIRGLQARVELLERRVSSIVEARDLYWDQYLSLGTRTALDLLNAEQEIGQAAEELDNARHDLWSAQLEHLLAAGQARAAFGLDEAASPEPEAMP